MTVPSSATTKLARPSLPSADAWRAWTASSVRTSSRMTASEVAAASTKRPVAAASARSSAYSGAPTPMANTPSSGAATAARRLQSAGPAGAVMVNSVIAILLEGVCREHRRTAERAPSSGAGTILVIPENDDARPPSAYSRPMSRLRGATARVASWAPMRTDALIAAALLAVAQSEIWLGSSAEDSRPETAIAAAAATLALAWRRRAPLAALVVVMTAFGALSVIAELPVAAFVLPTSLLAGLLGRRARRHRARGRRAGPRARDARGLGGGDARRHGDRPHGARAAVRSRLGRRPPPARAPAPRGRARPRARSPRARRGGRGARPHRARAARHRGPSRQHRRDPGRGRA